MFDSFITPDLRLKSFIRRIEKEKIIHKLIALVPQVVKKEYLVIKYTPQMGFMVFATDVFPDLFLLIFRRDSDYISVLDQITDEKLSVHDKQVLAIKIIQTALYLNIGQIIDIVSHRAKEMRLL